MAPVDTSNEIKLEFYGLFKQATQGDVSTPRPDGLFELSGKAKWDAWHSRKGMTVDAAKSAYIGLMDSHSPGWRQQ